jgi:hypothetical protein
MASGGVAPMSVSALRSLWQIVNLIGNCCGSTIADFTLLSFGGATLLPWDRHLLILPIGFVIRRDFG